MCGTWERGRDPNNTYWRRRDQVWHLVEKKRWGGGGRSQQYQLGAGEIISGFERGREIPGIPTWCRRDHNYV